MLATNFGNLCTNVHQSSPKFWLPNLALHQTDQWAKKACMVMVTIISHYLNLSISLPMVIIAILWYTPMLPICLSLTKELENIMFSFWQINSLSLANLLLLGFWCRPMLLVSCWLSYQRDLRPTSLKELCKETVKESIWTELLYKYACTHVASESWTELLHKYTCTYVASETECIWIINVLGAIMSRQVEMLLLLLCTNSWKHYDYCLLSLCYPHQ